MNSLEQNREIIDRIDSDILKLLAKRKMFVAEIAEVKKAQFVPVFQPKREKDIIERIKAESKVLGIDQEFAENIYRLILEQSKKEQI